MTNLPEFADEAEISDRTEAEEENKPSHKKASVKTIVVYQ